ncbi:MAG: NAD(P)/FAD-dependent oxidoreductase [Chitinophagaceae bacterium]|nr:NAD(P)/FAD-dependent oxidoreductase [Chitinophagaceae bacterium]MCW5905296.1 NAD(P)/FAD-dependent oxidoreductase [Chitinophagaceae bacterium]
MQKTLIVIGGGAAGFFCAVNAARLNPMLKVIIAEKSNKLLSKVKISGGGRCNVTHHCFDINELIKHYPRGANFLKKAFHWFNTNHTVEWFKQRGVPLTTEADGRMFPTTNSSQTIINCLLNEANKYGVEVMMNSDIHTIQKQENIFTLHTNNNKKLSCHYVCIATGGYPKLMQFEWIKNTGHNIETPVPSLFTFNIPHNTITQLMGISVSNAQIKIIGTKFQNRGALLITHWGFSGPAVLKLSAFAAKELAEKNYHFTIHINWLENDTEQSLQQEWAMLRKQLAANKIYAKNPFGLPVRLWQFLLHESDIQEGNRWADLTTKQQNKLIKNLTAQAFEVKGKTTFKEEFVTYGGVILNEIDVNTMQSKKIPHVYFAGEVVNIDGITGGFNFQNAWTTGFIAAKAIANEV